MYKIHNLDFTKISLHSYEAIIVMSKRIKDEIKNAKINTGDVLVVTDPIDLELFRPKDKENQEKSILVVTWKKFMLYLQH